MLGIGKTQAIREVESEITDLERRRAQLAKLHAQSLVGAAAAEANLGKFLDQGDLSAGLDGAQSAVHTARQNSIDLSAAVERQSGLIAAAQERLAQARDRELREKAALGREKAAETAAVELQRGIEAVALACDRLAAAIPHGGLDIRGVPERTIWGAAGRSPEQPLNPIEIARCILAEGLYQQAPELFEVIARNSDILVQLPLLTRRAGRVARAIQRDDIEFQVPTDCGCG